MQVNTIVRIVFGVLFVGTLVAGYFLIKNFERLLGVNPECPYENSGASGLNKVQVIVIWLHAVALTGAMAFFLP